MKLVIAALLASSAAAFTTSPAARVSSDVLVLERYGGYVYQLLGRGTPIFHVSVSYDRMWRDCCLGETLEAEDGY